MKPLIGTHQTPSFAGTIDLETDWILGLCRSVKPGATFVRPLAVLRNGQLQRLSETQRREAFPESGDLFASARLGAPPPPQENEYGLWQVEQQEHDPAHKAHCRLRRSRTIYELREIPFPPHDRDAVREWLRERGKQQSLQSPLFVLTDGTVVGNRSRPDFTRQDTFEGGLVWWSNLPSARFEDRVFVTGDLPAPAGVYECGTLASAVRKVFKAASFTSVGITRGQLQTLAQSLESSDPSQDGQRIDRVRRAIETIDQNAEAWEALLSELLRLPLVEERVNRQVAEDASRKLALKAQLQQDVARLQRERSDLEQKLAKQKAEHVARRDELANLMKEAFDRARKKGMATFGDAAVIQALIQTPPTSVASGPSAWGPKEPQPRTLQHSAESLLDGLMRFGLSMKRAAAMASLAEASIEAGLIVFARGVISRPVVEAWARSVGHSGVLVDLTVGLLDDSLVERVLNGSPACDALALLDGNISALDLYGRAIADLVTRRVLQATESTAPAFFISVNEGAASLPIPKRFQMLSVTLDFDSRPPLDDVASLDGSSDVMADEDLGENSLWKPAAQRLRAALERLEPTLRSMALSILRNGS